MTALLLVDEGSLTTALGFVSTPPSEQELALIRLVHPLAEGVFRAWLGHDATYKQRVVFLPLGTPETGIEGAEEFQLRGQTLQVSVGVDRGSDVLVLPHTPVWPLSLEVREDVGAYAGQASGAFGSDSVLTLGTNYWLDIDDASTSLSNSGILRRFGSWPTEPRSVKVTYYGGETAARLASEAGNLRYACLLTIIKAYKLLKSMQGSRTGPKSNESIGKYSYGTLADVQKVMSGVGFTVPYEAQRAAWPLKNFGRLFG